MKFKYATLLISFLSMSLVANVVSATYILNKFKADQNNIVKINNLSSTLKQTTSTLVTTSNTIITNKNDDIFDKQFKKSFQTNTTINEITTPPYQDIGQIYWSNDYNSLISTNGDSSYIWVGSTWLPITNNGLITGTNKKVIDALNEKLGTLPNQSINIDSSGGLYNVQVSQLKGLIINLTSSVQISKITTQITQVHWDSSKHKLVGVAQGKGLISNYFNVAYSTTPDSAGSYWSDATLK